uniref:Uncharacterized protein n=1 Tax=Palpitomonas bilix TaxID=652834 RepID=A0A7S3DA62_9EUKA|mmetsp:Transcript_28910/g.74197  ORF Transcript_28910/g.74197 Transcript_28910/m.74197 type:complete len:106 (+) Transcript_28910:489-806(+)
MSVRFEDAQSTKLVQEPIDPTNVFRKAQSKSSNIFGFGTGGGMETEYRKQYSPPVSFLGFCAVNNLVDLNSAAQSSPTRKGEYAFGMATEVLGSMFPTSGTGGWK